MTRTERKHKVAEILKIDTPIEIELDPKKVEFLILYKHGLVQYLSPRQFSWIIGVHEDTVYKKIENKVYPYHIFFKKALGGGYRMHASHVASLMSGKRELAGDTRNKKRRSWDSKKDVAVLPMSAVSKNTIK